MTTIRIHRPELSNEERSQRMTSIKESAARLIMEAAKRKVERT